MNINALFKISYGLYIVSSVKDGKYNGFLGNALSQVNSEPPTFVVIVNKQNLTHDYIKSSKIFSVSILAENTPLTFIGKFGFKTGKETDKFQDTNFKIGPDGVPIVTDFTVAYIVCDVFKTVDMGSHTMFIGNLLDAEILSEEPMMTYDYYRYVKKGKTAKNAPTFINKAAIETKEVVQFLGEPVSLETVNLRSKLSNNLAEEENKMDKYVCDVCGYVYDPAVGDPDGGIKPGTKFEDIPADWVCPVCGAGKDQFSKE